MKRFAVIATILGSSLIALPALAQPLGSPARTGAPAFVGKPMNASMAGKRQNAGARLKRLGLDEQTAQRVIQIRQKYRTGRQRIKQNMRANRQRVAELLRSNSNDQNAYRAAIAGLQTARNEMQQSKSREFADLQKVLTPKQQAKLLAAVHKRGNKGERGHRRGNGARAGR